MSQKKGVHYSERFCYRILYGLTFSRVNDNVKKKYIIPSPKPTVQQALKVRTAHYALKIRTAHYALKIGLRSRP